MITALLTGIAANPWIRAALRYGAIALAILLFLRSIRRAGERAGRMSSSCIRSMVPLRGQSMSLT